MEDRQESSHHETRLIVTCCLGMFKMFFQVHHQPIISIYCKLTIFCAFRAVETMSLSNSSSTLSPKMTQLYTHQDHQGRHGLKKHLKAGLVVQSMFKGHSAQCPWLCWIIEKSYGMWIISHLCPKLGDINMPETFKLFLDIPFMGSS